MGYLSNLSSQPCSDEVDLIQVIRVLWDKKRWIILTATITTLLTGIYAFTTKEQWTSKAIVIPPKLTELDDYLNIRQEYHQILHQDLIDPKTLSEIVFSNFNTLAQSSDTRNEFFIESTIYKKLIKDKNEQARRLILFKLSNEFTNFKTQDTKKESYSIGNTISFSTENPVEAQNTLKELIDFINFKAFKLELDDFLNNIKSLLTLLRNEKHIIQNDLSINKSIQLENLNKAYGTAIKAGIKEYSKTFTDDNRNIVAAINDVKIPISDSQLADSAYLFLLGEKYLKAQIDIANEKGLVYPTRYYQIDFQLQQLEALLNKAKDIRAKTYRYHASPDYPVYKDSPKVALLLALGFLIGSILSASVILLRRAFKH